MKKIILTCAVLTVTHLACYGDVTFQWITGALSGGQGSLELAGDVLPSANRLIFGFYTADTSIEFNPDTGSVGTDVFLGAIDSGATAGRIVGAPLATTYPGPSDGYAYMVAFDIAYNASYNPGNMPGAGTYYGISVVSDRNNINPYIETFSDDIQWNLNPIIMDTQIVPEPTTLALLASGLGVVLVRRRKKQSA